MEPGPSTSDFNLTEFCDKHKKVKESIPTKEFWQEAIKFVEQERDLYRKLYTDHLKAGSGMIREELVNINYKESYETLQSEHSSLEARHNELLQQKDMWENKYAEMQVAKDASFEVKEHCLQKELQEAMRQCNLEKAKMDMNFKRQLNECHAKLRTAFTTINQLKCENAEMQNIQEHIAQNGGVAVVSCNHAQGIEYYQNMMRHQEEQINKLNSELQEKRAENFHLQQEVRSLSTIEQHASPAPSGDTHGALTSPSRRSTVSSCTDSDHFHYVANPIPAHQIRCADLWDADDYARNEEHFMYQTNAPPGDIEVDIARASTSSSSINTSFARRRSSPEINRILAARVGQVQQSEVSNVAAETADGKDKKSRKRRLRDESMLNESQSQD